MPKCGWICGLLVVLACSAGAAQQAAGTGPRFEVVALKPHDPDKTGQSWDSSDTRVTASGYTLRDLILNAYELRSNAQVVGGPAWLTKDKVDLQAKVDEDEAARIKAMTGKQESDEWRLLMRAMLAERFGLRVTPQQRVLPAYALVVDHAAPALAPEKTPAGEAPGTNTSMSIRNGALQATGVPMENFAYSLTGQPECGGRVVMDHTGLKGRYDFSLKWTPDRGAGLPADSPYPGLFSALREQLGLKLVPEKTEIPVVVVDAATPPESD